MVSGLPRPGGGAGWSIEATSTPWASPSGPVAGGFLMSPRYRKVITAIRTTTTPAPTVQPSSSRSLPRICAGSGPPRRARYLTSDQISTPSTSRKIGIEM